MPKPGDKVAVVSPSRGLPELFPAPYELGLRRLREDFGLVPVEYPTTRRLRSSPRERAADLHAAFADPDITAVIATIGGDDQITVLKYLDPDLLRANPKPFFGYSDNTNLLNYLHHLGLTSYHGGAVMVQFGRGGAMHPDSEASLRAAGTGWEWHHAETVAEGNLWGGCLEIIDWQLAASRWMRPVDEYDGVLFCETSEEMPSATAGYRMLRNAGERGLLARFDAVLWGRPKAWEFGNPLTEDEGRRFVADQYDAVRRALAEYNPDAMLVTGLDIGHTDPQLVLPYGGWVRVDGPDRRIIVRY